jgi:hypothetical protein
MSISKNNKFSSNINDSLLDGILSDTENIQEIVENNDGSGYVQFKNNPTNALFLPSLFNKEHLYSHFYATTHYEKNTDAEVKQDPDSYLKTDTSFQYNFYLKNYERYLNENPNLFEVNLPYYYFILSEQISNPVFKTTTGQSFFDKDLSTLVPTNTVLSDRKVNYFSSKIFKQIENNVNVFSLDKYFNEFSGFKFQFPFYSQILIDNLQSGKLCDAFDEQNMFVPIFKDFFSSRKPINLNLSGQTKTVFYSDLKKFIKSYVESLPRASLVNIPNLINSIENLAQSKKILFSDILNKKLCYSEAIGYKITKHQDFGPNPEAIQTWYLPNVFTNVVEFIDSQIKYNKKYMYKISILYAVLDTRYKYLNYNVSNNTLLFNNKNMLNIYEIESTTYTNKLLDNPPLEPEVEFLPFMSVSNKIKINLNSSIGKKQVNPIVFSQSELAIVDELYSAQNKPEKLIFKSEEPSRYFEIRRAENPPKSYEDFMDSTKIEVFTDNSSAASYTDQIENNKKYYYIFRSFDVHGNFSNPSNIYEIEIINDSGLIIPIIKEFYIKKQKITAAKKPFKKYLSIKPSYLHTALDTNKIQEDAITDIRSVPVGTQNDSVWDKNFKLRITSKSTGRKIDLNFSFFVKRDNI